MAGPTIAAVIPVHNKGPHVARALESVRRQTRPVDEVIVVDDASTDDSAQVLAAFDHPRLRILRRDVPGPGGYAARNLGVASATSDWVAFLDADDAWYDHHVWELAALIDQAGAGTIGVFTGWERVWPDGRRQRDIYSAALGQAAGPARLDLDGFLRVWIAQGAQPIWTSACAFRREALTAAGLFPEGRCRRGGDKDMWLRAMALGEALSTPRVCAAYHQETVNQVTRVESSLGDHCIWPTLDAMSADCPEPRRRMLAELRTADDFFDFRRAAAQARFAPVTGGRRGWRERLRGPALGLLVRLPTGVQRTLRRLATAARSRARSVG